VGEIVRVRDRGKVRQVPSSLRYGEGLRYSVAGGGHDRVEQDLVGARCKPLAATGRDMHRVLRHFADESFGGAKPHSFVPKPIVEIFLRRDPARTESQRNGFGSDPGCPPTSRQRRLNAPWYIDRWNAIQHFEAGGGRHGRHLHLP
jgi:hypothetical protein